MGRGTRSRGGELGSWLLLILIVVVGASILGLTYARGAFAREETAIRTLETAGYSKIHITDHSWAFIGWRGCDANDAAKFTATAVNPVGKEVELIVCTGLFKGGTVRVP